jgi:hypothetical protein
MSRLVEVRQLLRRRLWTEGVAVAHRVSAWVSRTWPRVGRLAEALALVTILFIAAAMTFYRVDEPGWEAGHHGFLLSQHATNARNMVRYGYISSGLCLLTCHGYMDDSGDLRQACGTRTDNPPLMHVLMSLSYRMLGDSPAASRLPSALASVGLVLVCYLTARRVAAAPIALLAAVFAGLLPIRTTYGRLAEVVVPAVFFSALAVYLYVRWTTGGSRWSLWLSALSFVAAVASGWNGYFTAVALAIAYVTWGRRLRPSKLLLVAVVVAPLAAFASHLSWAYWCGGSEQLCFLYEKFLFRTVSAGDQQYTFTTLELLDLLIERLPDSVTSTVAGLACLGLADSALRAVRGRLTPLGAITLGLAGYWVSCLVLLQNTVFIHDYFMYYGSVPFFAVAAAEGVRTLAGWLPLRNWVSLSLVAAISLLFFIPQAVSEFREHSGAMPTYAEDVQVGQSLSSLTSPDQVLLFSSPPGHPRMRYYLDRAFLIVTDVESLKRELTSPSPPPLYVLNASAEVEDGFRRYLFEHYPVEQMGSYSVFRLSHGPGTVFDRGHPVSASLPSDSAASIELLEARVTPEEVSPGPEPRWWERYLNAHPELLPENQTRITVTYVWRALQEPDQDYGVITRLVHVLTDETVLETRREPFSGNLRTSSWLAGETLREQFELTLPQGISPGRYRLECSLVDAQGKRIPCSQSSPDPQPHVRVVPAAPPVSAGSLPDDCVALSSPLSPPLEVAGWCARPESVDVYWRSRGATEETYASALQLTSEGLSLQVDMGVLAVPSWEPGALYRTRARFSPGLLPGEYQVQLAVRRETDPDQPWLVDLGAHVADGEAPSLLVRKGQPDGNGEVRIGPKEPVTISFALEEQRDLQLTVRWSGRSQLAGTRVQVWLDNDTWAWTPKLLRTLAIPAGEPTTTVLEIPRRLTVAGQNRVFIKVAQPGEAYFGWRLMAVTLVPNLKHLIRDSYQPYTGWVDADYVDVALAGMPQSRAELLAVAGFYESHGLYSRALAFLEAAVAEGGADVTTAERLRLARLYSGQGATEKAMQAYRALLESVSGSGALSQSERETMIEALHSLASLTEVAADRRDYETAIRALLPSYSPALLGETIWYLGHEISPSGDATRIRLYFLPVTTPTLDYAIWMHARPENPGLLPEDRVEYGYLNLDHPPLEPTSQWPPQRLYVDERDVELADGCYNLSFGFWHSQSRSRLLTASGEHGIALERVCVGQSRRTADERAQVTAD